MARVAVQHAKPECDGILPGGVGQLIDEHFRRIGGVGAADRPPPQHRNAHVRGVQVQRQVGDGVGKVVRALDRCLVDPVLDQRVGERRVAQNRLTHDAVVPADDASVSVQPSTQGVIVHGPIAAALDVVLAGPHHFDRCAAVDRFGHGNGLGDHVCVRGGATAKAAAGQQRMHGHLLGWQAADRRCRALVDGRHLRAGPDLARLGTQFDHAVQGLHRCVGQERKLERGVQHGCGIRHGRFGIAVQSDDRTRALRQLLVFGHDIGAGAGFRGAFVPVDDQCVASGLRRPKPLGQYGNAARHLDHVDHTVNGAGGGVVHRTYCRAKHGWAGQHGGQHAGSLDVEGEHRRAARLGVGVKTRRMLADQHEVGGVLQCDLGRGIQGRRGVRQFAESGPAARRRMADHALADGDVCRRHVPRPRRRLDQHGTGGGAGAAHLLVGIGDRR